MSVILKAESISKQYRLGKVGTGTLGHDLNRFWASIRGKEDPYLKVGAVNDRSVKAAEDYVWALQDINFEVKTGEILGIIGKNGAGKSTLLKILSRVTSPTTGSIKTRGRIASLLEVGTGFHGELSGRENIFMNGAVLGMTKSEIHRKLDEIIDFSGCEMYIDTPVKRYSSGMTVRLGFAVAAHLEPEILVVDEVLAVGDAEFQKKAIGKMQDLSTGEGSTVLFVSHNMASIQNLCTQGLLLNNGRVDYFGKIEETVNRYLETRDNQKSKTEITIKKFKSPFKSRFSYLGMANAIGKDQSAFKMGESINVIIKTEIIENFQNLGINVRLNDSRGNRIAAWRTKEMDVQILSSSGFTLQLLIKDLNVFEGIYNLSFALLNNDETLDFIENALQFEIIPSKIDLFPNKVIAKSFNIIYTPCEWNFSYNG